MTRNEETFVKITNKEIFDRISSMDESNQSQHRQIIERLDKTNGRVKLTYWLGTTALSIVLITLGFLLNHISK